jgi:hypothetical protein
MSETAATTPKSEILPEELMNSVLGKLYDTLTSGDGEFLEDRRSFFAWATPGLPLTEDQFDFMSGFLPQAETVEKREAEASRRFALAADFSRLVDFLPDPRGIFDDEQQTTVLADRRGTLSGEYERVLRMSEVAEQELTDEQKAKLEKFQDLLLSRRVEKDIITDQEKELVDDSELVKRYNQKYAAYEAAALEFNSARIDALSGAVPGAAARFAINGPILGRKVRAAMDDWEAAGRRNDIDRIRAFISQVTGRSMVLYKQNLIERLGRTKLSDAVGGAEFLYTALTPANVLRAPGWTKFTFTHSEVDRFRSSQTNKWKAGGGALFGAVNFGGKGGGSKEKLTSKIDITDFSLTFELTQVVISRAWFAPEFLESHGWRFPPGNQPLSDGKEPPQVGTLIAYPETMILARNISLNLRELSSESSTLRKQASAGGGLSWGPINLGGSYSRGGSEQQYHSKVDAQGISAQGPQIIGYRCNLVGEAPDPDPSVTNWV